MMLCKIEIGKAIRKASLASYWVIANTLGAAMAIAQVKAKEEHPEEDDNNWYEVIEAEVISGSDPLRLEVT